MGEIGLYIVCSTRYLVLQTSFAQITILSRKRIVLLFGLFLLFKMIFGRCTDELAAVPGQGLEYIAILSKIETIFSEWLPFLSDSFKLMVPFAQALDSSALDEQGSCVAVKSTLLYIFGFLLPITILAAEETMSQRAYELRHHIGSPFVHRTSTFVTRSLLIVPFEAAVGYYAIIRGLHLLNAMEPGLLLVKQH